MEELARGGICRVLGRCVQRGIQHLAAVCVKIGLTLASVALLPRFRSWGVQNPGGGVLSDKTDRRRVLIGVAVIRTDCRRCLSHSAPKAVRLTLFGGTLGGSIYTDVSGNHWHMRMTTPNPAPPFRYRGCC
jgi:hypothetical protein